MQHKNYSTRNGMESSFQGQIQDFWKGGSYLYKGVGVADFISFFLMASTKLCKRLEVFMSP